MLHNLHDFLCRSPHTNYTDVYVHHNTHHQFINDVMHVHVSDVITLTTSSSMTSCTYTSAIPWIHTTQRQLIQQVTNYK